jgi:hypothetical protein
LSRTRPLLALAPLFVVCAVLPSGPASGGTFTQGWALGGWHWGGLVGNLDADPAFEALLLNKSAGHYGVLDEVTGVVEKQFPSFTVDNAGCTPADLDADGRPELVFVSHPHIAPPFFQAYEWSGSDYVPLLAHADPVVSWSLAPYRNDTVPEIYETSGIPGEPNCDFRLRSLAGAVLFRASTHVGGWSAPLQGQGWLDLDSDGIHELLLEDQAKILRFHEYSGNFTVAWTLPGWSRAVPIGDLDGDPQPELLVTSLADEHFAIVDALTGAIEQEFPSFKYAETSLAVQEVDGDPGLELTALKQTIGQPPVFSVLEWNGAGYVSIASVTAAGLYSNLGLSHLRSPGQVEVLELGADDVIVRELSGAVLFQASTQVPGWAVTPFSLGFQLADPDQDGQADMLLYDESHVWDIRYTGTFAQAWVVDGWSFFQQMGNMDADAGSEFMLTHGGDGRYGLFDGVTGALQQEFPAFTRNDSQYQSLDVDANGHPELFFGRQPGQTPLFTAYKWNGAHYGVLSSHAQSMGSWTLIQARSDHEFEFLESDDTDVRIRDVNGSVVFRASTDLPAWPGLPNSFGTPATGYPPTDGVRGLYVFDDQLMRLVLHHPATTGVPGAGGATVFRVHPNAPNPFRASTAFRVSLPVAGEVSIRVYDAGGRLVRRLDRRLPAGEGVIPWDGLDDRGGTAPSGVLFYEVTSGGHRQARKLIRLG